MSGTAPQVYLVAFGLTDKGEVRPANEDAFAIADLTADANLTGASAVTIPVGPRGVLLAVSDGMGGAAAGEVASALVVESVRDHLNDDCRVSELQEAIRCAVERANLDVWNAAQAAGRRGMGATLVAVLVHRVLAHFAAVGDSRAYIIRDGRIRQVTEDQSYVAVLVRAGMLSREEAERSPYRHIILQAMGQRPDVTVALGHIKMRRGDLFLLCSDGLTEKVKDEELLLVIRQAPSYEAACSRLVELANARGGEDNITVVIAGVGGDGLPEARSSESVTQTMHTVQTFDPTAPSG